MLSAAVDIPAAVVADRKRDSEYSGDENPAFRHDFWAVRGNGALHVRPESLSDGHRQYDQLHHARLDPAVQHSDLQRESELPRGGRGRGVGAGRDVVDVQADLGRGATRCDCAAGGDGVNRP
jgi:hypothetical protein